MSFLITLLLSIMLFRHVHGVTKKNNIPNSGRNKRTSRRFSSAKGWPALQDPLISPVPRGYEHILPSSLSRRPPLLYSEDVDHCHFQVCTVNNGRKNLSDDLCGHERSLLERVSCLERRRGFMYNKQEDPSNSIHIDFDAPPWPLEAIKSDYKEFVFLKV